jgi:hypothetical protein
MRAIGGTEGTKWKKSNEFNSSEPSSGPIPLTCFKPATYTEKTLGITD